jgi:hypothetical protein
MELKEAAGFVGLVSVVTLATVDGTVGEDMELPEHAGATRRGDALFHQAGIGAIADRPIAVLGVALEARAS